MSCDYCDLFSSISTYQWSISLGSRYCPSRSAWTVTFHLRSLLDALQAVKAMSSITSGSRYSWFT